MGETEGSSTAARSAQPHGHNPKQAGVFRRILGLFNTSNPEVGHVNGASASAPKPHVTGMINLRRMRVEDVAIPRADIVAVPDTITKADLVQVFRDSGLTRLPVYSGTLDTPVGFAHLKDFALSHGFNGNGGRFILKRMLRTLLFVPPSMPIGVLLTKMQTERRHMALVIDEYGGVDGLVTIEDLIEQVIGEIEDEHDTEDDRLWTREKPGCYLAMAKTPLAEFEAEIGMALTDHEDIDAEEIDTLGGLVFMLAGHVPARGEMVTHPTGAEIEVVDADPRRIKRLRFRMPGVQSAPKPAARTAVAADG